MTKKDERIFWQVAGGIVAFVLIVWFLSKFLDILKQNPQPLWFILGVIATLVVEALIYWGVGIFKRKRGY